MKPDGTSGPSRGRPRQLHSCRSPVRREDLCQLPLVLLRSSGAREDIVESYRLGANRTIKKLVDLDGFLQIVKAVGELRFSFPRLPSKG